MRPTQREEDLLKRITVNPNIFGGKPIIRGRRLAVEHVHPCRAHGESRVLVTLDKDFGELAIVHGQEHSGIVRLVALSTTQQAEMCVAVLAKYGPELEAGSIVTVEASRVRVRPSSQGE